MLATSPVFHTLDLQFCFDNSYTFVVFNGIAECNSVHATINNNAQATVPTVRIVAKDFTCNNSIWATISCPHYRIQRVRISEVHCIRLSTVKHSRPTEMSDISCVRFSEVSGVGGSTVCMIEVTVLWVT